VVRTIEEAVEIAKKWGVVVPDDVAFILDVDGEFLDELTTARGPDISRFPGGLVGWRDFVHDRTGKVPLFVRRDIMESDEAIVAVFTHELYELAALRKILARGRTITLEEFVGYCAPDNPANLHDEAWDAADRAVLRMRKGKSP